MKKQQSMRRREFLKKAPLAVAGAAAFPTIIQASALGLNGAVPPSGRIVMAGIGFGMQGPGNMQNFLGKNEVQAAVDRIKSRLTRKQAAGGWNSGRAGTIADNRSSHISTMTGKKTVIRNMPKRSF